MERQYIQCVPFYTRVLSDTEDGHDIPVPLLNSSPLSIAKLLPAAYMNQSKDIAPAIMDVRACLRTELDLKRLRKVYHWLWVAGRMLPPRALHHQILMGREIFVTEQMDMHLVWTTGRIFIKPMARFLLEPRFWNEYLRCQRGCKCAGTGTGVKESPQECERRQDWKCAHGFLSSYIALIRHESDFLVAKDKGLLPKEMSWAQWIRFVQELGTNDPYCHVDRRFYHGELRLSRLNKIYCLFEGHPGGYVASWDQYGTFFRDNFAWLAGTTVYIAVVLTAMQVGLATEPLAQNEVFQSASYGFTLFSIVGPLACAGLIVLAASFIFIYNWAITLIRRNARWKHISRGLGET